MIQASKARFFVQTRLKAMKDIIKLNGCPKTGFAHNRA
jgi:hypothetical protein